MNITHQTVVDSHGNPSAVLIPWEVFVHIKYLLGESEVSEDEAAAIREAEADRLSGNHEAFTDLATLKAELSL